MNFIYLTLLALAFITLECLAGGTRLIYSLPAYALLGLASLLTVFSIKPAKIIARPLCLISSGLFFGYILIRAWCSPVAYLARPDIMMVMSAVAVYLITALRLVRSKYRMYFIAVLLVIAVGQLVVGLIQFSKGNEFVLFYQRHAIGNRASGQYVSPNHLAGFLEVVGIMGVSLVFWSTWKAWAKVLAGYVSLVSFAGVLITGSRGGYVSTAFCILVFCALSFTVIKLAYPERLLRVLLIGGLALGLVAGALPFVITSPLVKSRSAQILDTNNMRLLMWQAAWKEIQIEPLTGTGSATYLYYGRKFRDPQVQLDPMRVHNDYIDLLAEYGVVGAVGFLFFLGSHLWNGMHTFFWLVRKRLQFSPDWRSSSLALNIGCLCAVAAYLVHSVVDFNLHIPANCIMMAFIFGMLANPGLETFQEKKPAAGTNRVLQYLLPVLGVAIMAIGIPKIPGEYYAEKARVALRDKNYLQATIFAKAGIQWEKENSDLYYYLGEAERNIGLQFPSPALGKSFYAVASEAFKKAVELFPEDERLLLIEGWTLDMLGQPDEGGKYYQQALDWDPHSIEVQDACNAHRQFLKTSVRPESVP